MAISSVFPYAQYLTLPKLPLKLKLDFNCGADLDANVADVYNGKKYII